MDFTAPKPLRTSILMLLLIVLAGCFMRQSWHWEKAGAGEEAYEFDLQQCKAKTYAGSSGLVTNETVRRMFTCMEGKGWRKVDN